jgi:hypothetical protein
MLVPAWPRGLPRPFASRQMATAGPQPPRVAASPPATQDDRPAIRPGVAMAAAGNERNFAAASGQKLLFVAEPAEAAALESPARKRDGSLDTAAIRVIRVRYSLVHLAERCPPPCPARRWPSACPFRDLPRSLRAALTSLLIAASSCQSPTCSPSRNRQFAGRTCNGCISEEFGR